MSYDLTKAAWTFVGCLPLWTLGMGLALGAAIWAIGSAIAWVRGLNP